MRENKIPFGERDGTLFRSHEVDNGLRCGCICPGCRQLLNAANNGEKVVPHFRHAQSNDCTDGVREGVRRAAVALIVQHKGISLEGTFKTSPRVMVGGLGRHHAATYQMFPPCLSAQLHCQRWKLRPLPR